MSEAARFNRTEKRLRRMRRFDTLAILIAAFILPGNAQQTSPAPNAAPLVLTGAIPLPSVKGRIDHFGFNSVHNRLFVSALGNNTEEIIGLSAQTVIHTISGIPTPQGVVYSPETNKVFVGSDQGKLYIYDGASFDFAAIDFGHDVDNLRYEALQKQVYVGYGDEKTGAIGVVDAATNKRLEVEFKLGAHPESFQLSGSGPEIYVTLPDLKQIAVINGSTRSITRWLITSESNFPMALDDAHHRLFVATRAPVSWRCSTRTRVAWLPHFRPSKTRTTSIRFIPQAHLYPRRRRLYQCVLASRSRPLRTSR